MYCKNLSKAFNGKLKCKTFKRVIILDECTNCLNFHPRGNKGIKKRTSKLKKIEEERYSILTNDLEHCYYCKRGNVDMHEIYRGRNRLASMKNGFCIPLCRRCHRRTEDDIEFYRKFQRQCKKKFLENHSIEEFIKIIN